MDEVKYAGYLIAGLKQDPDLLTVLDAEVAVAARLGEAALEDGRWITLHIKRNARFGNRIGDHETQGNQGVVAGTNILLP